eukprot:Awhi_evm1s7762
MLQHRETKKVRLLMRRDNLQKVCANHYLTPDMFLKPMHTAEHSWIWTVGADFSEVEPTPSIFALRLRSEEDSTMFATLFDKYTQIDRVEE